MIDSRPLFSYALSLSLSAYLFPYLFDTGVESTHGKRERERLLIPSITNYFSALFLHFCHSLVSKLYIKRRKRCVGRECGGGLALLTSLGGRRTQKRRVELGRACFLFCFPPKALYHIIWCGAGVCLTSNFRDRWMDRSILQGLNYFCQTPLLLPLFHIHNNDKCFTAPPIYHNSFMRSSIILLELNPFFFFFGSRTFFQFACCISMKLSPLLLIISTHCCYYCSTNFFFFFLIRSIALENKMKVLVIIVRRIL